jgi:hypothetical protein
MTCVRHHCYGRLGSPGCRVADKGFRSPFAGRPARPVGERGIPRGATALPETDETVNPRVEDPGNVPGAGARELLGSIDQQLVRGPLVARWDLQAAKDGRERQVREPSREPFGPARQSDG